MILHRKKDELIATLNEIYTLCWVGYTVTGVPLIESPIWMWNLGRSYGISRQNS